MANMGSPQWKNYQAPVADPAIVAFSRNQRGPKNANQGTHGGGTQHKNSGHFNGTVINNSSNRPTSTDARETGVVEKLLHSYGFVQCCDRDARLFFHYSEYAGNLDTVKIGDAVEFQMSFDRRTGKPIAVDLVPQETPASFEVLSDKRVFGTVVAEAKSARSKQNGGGGESGCGRVSYEQSGEHFFLQYSAEDVENGLRVNISVNDTVSFLIATDKRSGAVNARQMRLEKAAEVERVQGVVCSMKDTYGFIERADVVREIFFHFSEFQGEVDDLVMGDDVDFVVQNRPVVGEKTTKEVAVDVKSIPEGSVIFEDVAVEKRRGKVTKTLRGAHGRRHSDPLAGRIVYETLKGPIEIPFGDKDQKGDFTLQPGDLVDFKIATDRRDKLQRATQISLILDTFKVNGEKRETGVIASVKDGFGFIRCAERDARMFFHFSELLDTEGPEGPALEDPEPGEEVAFTVVADPAAPTSRLVAVRIARLPRGSVRFETIGTEKHSGTIEKESFNNLIQNKAKNKDTDPGIISYDVNGTKQMIPFGSKAVNGANPKLGDKVEFLIEESRRTGTRTAVMVRVTTRAVGARLRGYVATMKESFGFIETADHDQEVFFHFSNVEGCDSADLDLGDEVEYSLARGTNASSFSKNRISAEGVRRVPADQASSLYEVESSLLEGRVIRAMRTVNPDQDEYCGLIQCVGQGEEEQGEVLPYGITSLADKRDFLQNGDRVKLQAAVHKENGKRRAVNITALRKLQRARIDSLKGQFGFLQYEAEEGKKLFFHMTEVHGDSGNGRLQNGDTVEFVVVQNQRNKKYAACSVRKISSRRDDVPARPRPERLISRLKSVGEEAGPRVTTLRQPRGPSDQARGFLPRLPWPREVLADPPRDRAYTIA